MKLILFQSKMGNGSEERGESYPTFSIGIDSTYMVFSASTNSSCLSRGMYVYAKMLCLVSCVDLGDSTQRKNVKM